MSISHACNLQLWSSEKNLRNRNCKHLHVDSWLIGVFTHKQKFSFEFFCKEISHFHLMRKFPGSEFCIFKHDAKLKTKI